MMDTEKIAKVIVALRNENRSYNNSLYGSLGNEIVALRNENKSYNLK